MNTIEELRHLISDGYCIKWVGYHSQRHVWVHLHAPGKETKALVIYLEKDYTEANFIKIRSSFADNPQTNTGTIWSSDTRLNLLRLASILGINVGGTAHPGSNKTPVRYAGCAMGYDIESDRSQVPLSSFDTLSASMLSLATYCSCGEIKVFSFFPRVKYDYILCKNSSDIVRQFLLYVRSHSPQWLIGYNNFAFDNSRIQFHAPPEFDSILIPMKVGVASSRSLACYIDSYGTYNIDLITLIDKVSRSEYTNLSLKTVARESGLTDNKIDFDTAKVTDFVELFKYNVQDSKVTMMLGLKKKLIELIETLSVVVCGPTIDIDRFTSGTFSCTAIASWCLENRICMDWSSCTKYIKYEGAHVIKPVLGLHSNVYSCDFSSMYPTILMSANISIENCKISRTSRTHGSVSHTDKSTTFSIGGLKYSYSKVPPAVIPRVIRDQVNERKIVKVSNPLKAKSLKLSSNSIYGSTGDYNSQIYAPGCSSSITAGGRICLALAECVLRCMGYEILYGDTDSAHIGTVSNKVPKSDPWTCTRILSRIFDFTAFPGMSMEVECLYEKIAYFGKKTYFGRSREDISEFHKTGTGIPAKVVSKGMSKSRKDRIGVCRTLSSYVVDIILSDTTLESKQELIGNMIACIIDEAVSNRLLLKDVSKIVKRSGQNYYEYVSRSGRREFKECEIAIGTENVEYSASHVASLVVREVKYILAVTGIGTVEMLLSMSSDI